MFDNPAASLSAYGGDADAGSIEELIRIAKRLGMKVKYTYEGYAWYSYDDAKKVYSARSLDNAIDTYNQSAAEEETEQLKKKTAEFNGYELGLDADDRADALHDAAIWRDLAK